MSQTVGLNFKSKIPTLSDDASIEEALRVYHYGVDNYISQSIPDDSIEGNFRSIDNRVSDLETIASGLDSNYLQFISKSASPNIVTAQATTVIPFTVRSIVSQTSNLQEWQNSSNNAVAAIDAGGYFSTASYMSIGSIANTSTTALNISIITSTHKGIVVKAATSQSGNLQEWQNSSSSILSLINSAGSFATSGYIVSGSNTASSTTAISANISNQSHKGIVVKSASSQSANLQEWQNSSGTAISWVTSDGKIYVRGTDVESITGGGAETFNQLMLMGA